MDDVCRELISPLPKIQFVAQVQAEEITPTPAPEPKTEKEKIKAYLKEKFGDRYEDGLKMLETCENSTLDPRRVSALNIQKSGRRSYDVGVMQINVDENNKAEMERLKDYKYNIDRGYEKFKAKGNTFYAWTCGYVAGDRTYVDALNGK